MSYLVQLQKFEGPMGLLLYLIRKEEMDIFDINVSELTKQYLEYIRQMRELDLEVAGEFVAMAATLLQIKSRMLLPQYGDNGEPLEQPDDPRKELVQKLLEYRRFQDAGRKLYERPILTRDIWTRGFKENYLGDGDTGEIIVDADGLFGMIATYRQAMRRMKRAVHQVRDKGVSIAGRIMEIKHLLIVGTRVNMRELLSETGPGHRKQLLITFLSMLELGRMGFVSLFQNETYGDIYVEATKPIERNVLERVQEFDSQGNEGLANRLIEDAALDRLAEAAPVSVDSRPDAPQTAFALLDVERDPSDPDFVPLNEDGVEAASDDEIESAEIELAASVVVPRDADV